MAPGVLNFAAGQSSKTFNVALINDNLHEPTETVNLVLSNPTGGAALGPQGKSNAVIKIADDEIAAPGTLQFSNAVFNTKENWGYAVIYVTRSAGTLGQVSVNYAITNGTAIAGQDYQAVSGVLTFATGETTKSFNVPLINDLIFESEESVNLLLASPTGGASIGARSTALLTITDDDP